MAKERTAHSYELELKKMIKARKGECEIWLNPQIRATASNMVILDKIQSELESATRLVAPIKGSTGQIKNEVDPRLAYYDKLQRTLLMQYEALCLNFNTNPSKARESVNDNDDDNNPMRDFYEKRK